MFNSSNSVTFDYLIDISLISKDYLKRCGNSEVFFTNYKFLSYMTVDLLEVYIIMNVPANFGDLSMSICLFMLR